MVETNFRMICLAFIYFQICNNQRPISFHQTSLLYSKLRTAVFHRRSLYFLTKKKVKSRMISSRYLANVFDEDKDNETNLPNICNELSVEGGPIFSGHVWTFPDCDPCTPNGDREYFTGASESFFTFLCQNRCKAFFNWLILIASAGMSQTPARRASESASSLRRWWQ